MAAWRTLTVLCFFCCFQTMTNSQLIDEDLLEYLKIMSYMSSMSRDTTSMVTSIPIPTMGRTTFNPYSVDLVTSIARDVMTALTLALNNPTTPSGTGTVGTPTTSPEVNAASEVPNVLLTSPPTRGDMAGPGPNLFPNSFNVYDGTLRL